MASVRPLLNSAPQQRSVAMIPSMSHRGHTFAIGGTTPACFMKYRPLRQPQFNRKASSASSQPSSTPTSTSRSLHSSTTSRQAGATLKNPGSLLQQQVAPEPLTSPPSSHMMAATQAPLSILPLPTILRSLAVTTLSSSSLLLPPSLAIMNLLAHTANPLLNPDNNPLLRSIIKSTFYTQFCAGENAPEVRATMAKLKGLGFSGVILGYAREVVLTEAQTKDLVNFGLEGSHAEAAIRNEVVPWAKGTLETVRLASEGDYVALKFTGAGRHALYTLAERLPPPAALADAIDEICSLAAARGVRLLFDAEQQAVQHGIDDWTLHYMRKYNNNPAARQAVVYGTYQAYLKATPRVLSEHLRAARDEGFVLGVKLVRGAYLHSDPRELIHDTKADTDACYDGIAEALLRRAWVGPLAQHAPSAAAGEDGGPSFPDVNMVLASHNADTVRRARAVLEEGATKTQVAFAQLQGMADEVSCEILAAKAHGAAAQGQQQQVVQQQKPRVPFTPRAYKYLVWGSTGECMKYLLRRAQENRDAVQRTKSGRDAMRAEVWRRCKRVFGLA